MQIPPDKNSRAEAMWRIISQRVDFRGKRVIDLGCGTGDFLWRAYVAGAREVIGVDTEYSKIKHIKNFDRPEISFAHDDIDISVQIKENWFGQDIAFCFSVLPYLNDVPATLKWMSSNFPLCLIECQYHGDGPGLKNIGGDRGMMQLLISNGFDSAEPIGQTRIEGRLYAGMPVHRTIWLCETK